MFSCLVALALAAPPAGPELYKEAAALYKEGKFEAAAEVFERGWAETRDPAFLFNAATAWGKIRRYPRAADGYEAFLLFRDVARPQDVDRARERLTRIVGGLSKTHGRIEVRTRPPGAAVSINGIRAPGPRWLKAGEASVAVTEKGFEPVERAVVLAAGERALVSIDLTPLAVGELVVESFPPGASVRIKGEEVGLTPLELTIPVGTHEVEVVGEGGTRTLTAEVRERSVTRLDVPLGERAEHTSVVEKWWFWTAIGAVVIAGVATAVVLTGDDSPGEADWGVWAP